MPENLHDKGYKRMLAKKKNFLSLLKGFIHEAWVSEINEDDVELIDKEFVLKDFKERESDIIYRISHRGKEVIFYCLLELQSTVDHAMPFRLLIYMTELWRRCFGDSPEAARERADYKLPAIIPIVLYNGRGEWTAVRKFSEYLSESDSFGSRVVDFEYILLNIHRYSDETLKEIGNLISSVFLLDKCRNDTQLKNNMAIAVQLFAGLTGDEQIDFKDWLRDVLLRKIGENDQRLVEKAILGFEKGDVAHMTYAIERIFDEEKEKAFKFGIEAGVEKGVEKGIERGIGIGREERNIELARLMLADHEPLEKIAKWTSLSISAIKALQK